MKVDTRFACGPCRLVFPVPFRRLKVTCPRCKRRLGEWVRAGRKFVAVTSNGGDL